MEIGIEKYTETTKTDFKQEPVQLFPNSQPNSITSPKPTKTAPSVIKDTNMAYFNTDETYPKTDNSTPLQD